MADLMSYSSSNEVGPLGMYHLLVKPPTHRFHESSARYTEAVCTTNSGDAYASPNPIHP
jgi:hypothetical protein